MSDSALGEAIDKLDIDWGQQENDLFRSSIPSWTRFVTVLLLFGLSSVGAEAATLHYWRFEDGPGFLADSAGTATLTAVGDAQSATLPATGRGGAFPSSVQVSGGGANLEAAELDGSGDYLTANTGITELFTVEALVHLDAAPMGFTGPIIVSNSTGPLLGQISWGLQIRTDGAGGSPIRELWLFVGFSSAQTFIFRSGLVLDVGKDYYLAAAFDRPGGQVTFYLQNLTDGGALQTATKPVGMPSMQSSTLFTIGTMFPGTISTDVNGLIDEVRLSSGVLSPEELLVSNAAIPALPPYALLALALGTAGWLARARAVRRAPKPA